MTKKVEVLSKQTVMGNEIMVYGTVENPLFFAKDVAEWIDHKDVSMMLKSVDEDEKVEKTNPNNACGGQKAWFLTEDGLYEVLMQSRKPRAKKIKKEIKRILHDLRVNGTVVSARMAVASPEEQALSFQKALDNAVQHAIQIAEAHFAPQIEELNRQKAWIADRQTATAMQTASAKARRVNHLEMEKEMLENRLDEIQIELDGEKYDAERYRSWRSKVGRPRRGYHRPDDYDDNMYLF